jgi:MFS family permease
VATAANLGGLGLGPLVAGLFAKFAPAPTELVFIVYLVLLVVTFPLVGVLPETVQMPDRVLEFRPRLGVASTARATFWQASVIAFCVFALLGFFGALVPTFLRNTLDEPNLALAGAVVFLLFGAATLSQLLLYSLTSRMARLAGLILLLFGLVLIEVSLALANLACFLGGTAVGGIGIGLAFMGSLAAINQIAPPERKSEMVSAFFVVAYIGITIPVVGVGLIAQETSLFAASLCLAAVLALLLLLTLVALLWPGRTARTPEKSA